MARILTKEEVAARRPAPTPVAPVQDMRPLIEGMIRAVQNITIPAPQVHLPAQMPVQSTEAVTMPEPIRKWVFSVQRDKEGYIRTITASAEGE
jgi:hypothetical protein